jgi:hypothetical protein
MKLDVTGFKPRSSRMLTVTVIPSRWLRHVQTCESSAGHDQCSLAWVSVQKRICSLALDGWYYCGEKGARESEREDKMEE